MEARFGSGHTAFRHRFADARRQAAEGMSDGLEAALPDEVSTSRIDADW